MADDWEESYRYAGITFTADAFEGDTVPPRSWQTPGLIPDRTVTLLGGDGGTGKSTLALQLCCASSAEMDWIGHTPKPGRSLYISAEDDSDEIHRRLDRIAVSYGIAWEQLAGVCCWDLSHDDALLAFGQPGKPLETSGLWHDLLVLVREWQPSLIVLDSLADFYGGNENDRGQVRQFVRLLRSLAINSDAAVLLLAHPSLSGLNSGSGTSGSTAWNNSVRSRLYFSRPHADDGGADASDLRTLQVMKANYAPSGGEYLLRYQGGAFVNANGPTVGLVDAQRAMDRIDQQFLALLDAFAAQGRNLSHRPGPGYAPSEMAKSAEAKGASHKGFVAAMERLFSSGAIRVETTGPASRQTSRIVRAGPSITPSNTP